MSSTLIGWIVTIVFIVILLGGFLVGFWRGFKKSTLNMIISFVGIIVAIFVTAPIAKAMLGIKVSSGGTKAPIEQVLTDKLMENKDLKQMLKANENLEVLVTNLPRALCNVIVFILVTIAIECVLYIIYKIVGGTLLKGKKGGRLFGGLVGTIKTFVVTCIAFMPLAGLIGLANKLTTTNDYSIEVVASASDDENKNIKGLLADKVPENVVIVVQGLENNMLTKCSSIFGLDNAMFDYLSGVKVEGGKVKIRKEIENFYDVADFGYQISQYNLNKIDYEKLNYDKVSKAVETLTSSEFFKTVLSKTVSDIIINYENYSFVGNNKNVNDMLASMGEHLATMSDVSAYFRDDLLNIVNTAKTLGKGGVINDVLDLESKSANNVAITLTTDENIDSFEDGLKNVMKLNLFRDNVPVLMEKLVEKVSSDLDKPNADTKDYTEEEWNSIATSLINIVKDFGEIAKTVDIFKVIEDTTILLDREENYDIEILTSKLGDIIDHVRANKLLQTAQGTPIIDKLLNKHDISLPTQMVVTNENKQIEIKTYKELFEFISPSLVNVRDEGIYELVKGEQTSESLITSLADIISKENKNNLLIDTIMPLYQIDVTRKLIIDELTSALGSGFINLGVLESYADWKNDLSLISQALINLNELKIGNDSYLIKAINGDFNAILKDIAEANVEKIFKPILEAKSTQAIKEDIFSGLGSELDNLTNMTNSLSIIGVSFVGEESQTEEICNVIKKFIAVNNSLAVGEELKNADKTLLSSLLETMKANAFRTENGKSEEGIFKASFVNLVDTLKSSYSEETQYVENSEQLLAELGVEDLSSANYSKINYATLLEMFADYQAMQGA